MAILHVCSIIAILLSSIELISLGFANVWPVRMDTMHHVFQSVPLEIVREITMRDEYVVWLPTSATLV